MNDFGYVGFLHQLYHDRAPCYLGLDKASNNVLLVYHEQPLIRIDISQRVLCQRPGKMCGYECVTSGLCQDVNFKPAQLLACQGAGRSCQRGFQLASSEALLIAECIF